MGAARYSAGHAYIYRIYGAHWCANVSAGAEGEGAAVLIRALEPLEGLDTMQERRGKSARRDLARGPGRLCQALAIDKTLDGVDLCAPGPLWIAQGADVLPDISQSARIGVTQAAEATLRFFERSNPHVSGSRQLNR